MESAARASPHGKVPSSPASGVVTAGEVSAAAFTGEDDDDLGDGAMRGLPPAKARARFGAGLCCPDVGLGAMIGFRSATVFDESIVASPVCYYFHKNKKVKYISRGYTSLGFHTPGRIELKALHTHSDTYLVET